MSAHRVDWTTPEMLNSGWTEVTSIVDQDSDNNRRRGLAIWYKIATASEPNTVETTWSGGSVGSSRHNTLLIQEFAGDYTLDVSTTHSSGSNAVNSLSTGTTAAAADSSALIIGAKAMREVGDAASWTNGFGSNIRVLSTDHGAPSPTTLQTAHRTSTTSQQWETTASWGGGAGEAVSAIVVFSDSGGQPNIDDESLCRGIAAGDSWTNVLCASEGQLCDLNDGSSCTVGRYVCQNNVQICERFPGNDDTCDSAACAGETVHETGLVQPNVQFLVDRSGSMNSGSLWHDTRELIKSLADWSYQGAGCDEGDTNCDYARLGVHFWSGNDPRGGPDEVERISPGEDTTASDVDGAFSIGPDGGTEFHQAARLTKNEVALDDPDRPNTAIFVTDGVPENAFTTAEAVREFCDLRKRANAPVATHAVGFYGGNINITSLIGAAGGTATCCFSTDGDCEGKTSVSPCQLYENELTNGADIVNTFETWLQNEQPSHYTEWIDLNDRIARHAHTEDAYRRGTVADDLDMINDVARWMLNKDAGINPDTIDCSSDSGDQTSSNPAEFYKWALCATEQTLSHVISHRYDNSLAKDVSGWSDFNYVYTENHDSTFLANDYTCTGAMFQSDPSDLYDGLHALMSGMECSYPLTLLDGHDSAPEFTDATYVRLYIPELGTVVRVPHTDDSSGQQAFKDELCAMGIPNCEDYATSGWEFSNSGRTSVQLTDELCDFTKSDAVERVTTQVCLTCDPDELGQPCEWVACNPDPSTIDDDTAYTSDGQFCRWVEHPCPDDPNSMCNSWAKTGRCGLGEYACDDNGRPTCVQVHSAMPEICNGIDDSCDGQIDNMSDNPTHPEWSQSQYDITDEPYDGWYCNYRDTCACPGGNPDSIGGYADDPDEFTSMMEHQQANGQCQCGEALSSAGPTNLEPTRSGPESTTGQPQATCSSTGDAGPHSLLTVALGLLLGVIGLRRRKR